MRQKQPNPVERGQSRSSHISTMGSKMPMKSAKLPMRISIAVFMVALSSLAFSQAARVDYSLQTSGPNVPYSGGPLPQALWVSNSQVYICTHPSATLAACQANPVTTYTDATKATTCFSTAQMVQLPGSTCTASSGVTANVGFWYDGGLVDYWVVSAYGTYGPFSIAGSGGSASFLAYVNGVAVITPGSANFVNSSSITVTNPSTNQIQFTAVGGAGCTMQGVAGTLNVSDGSGGCVSSPANYGATLANSFTFSPTAEFDVTAGTDLNLTATSNFSEASGGGTSFASGGRYRFLPAQEPSMSSRRTDLIYRIARQQGPISRKARQGRLKSSGGHTISH